MLTTFSIKQEGRERPINVIDTGNEESEITLAITKALSQEFRKMIGDCKNPYGDGLTAERVSIFLEKLEIDKKLIKKTISY